MGVIGGSEGLDCWESNCDREEGKGFQQSTLRPWQIKFLLQCSRSNPEKILLSEEPRWWYSLTWELGTVQVSLIQVLKPKASGASLSVPRQGS